MSTRAARQVAIATFVVAATLGAFAVTGVAAGRSDATCAANLYLEPAEPFETQELLLKHLAELYLRDADSNRAVERPALLAIAEAASAARTVARVNPNQHEYAVTTSDGRTAQVRLAQIDGGWVAEQVSVVVPSTVCDALANRESAPSE